MTLQQLQDKLLSWATADPRKEHLLAARQEHFARFGEPHEEDRSYEVRLNGMLDHYLYDFRLPGNCGTTLDCFLAEAEPTLAPEEKAAFRALAENVHGLFEVRRIRDGRIRLRDVFSGGDYDVTERRPTVGLEKGDLIEARLLPFGGELFLSGASMYHPREVRKAVLAEVKRLKKAAGKGGKPDARAFLAQLARMAMKLERYRNVRLESIYDFSAEGRATTPRPLGRE